MAPKIPKVVFISLCSRSCEKTSRMMLCPEETGDMDTSLPAMAASLALRLVAFLQRVSNKMLLAVGFCERFNGLACEILFVPVQA